MHEDKYPETYTKIGYLQYDENLLKSQGTFHLRLNKRQPSEIV